MFEPIIWDVDPEIFRIGSFAIRYYSLLFAGGLVLGYHIVKKMYLREGRSIEELDRMTLYIFIATVLGARLGHCLFYEPEYYLSHPLEMILPFTWKDGGFEFTGYQGLASHGGILAVFIAIWYHCRKTNTSFFNTLDKVSVAGALAGCFIRLGNFMNSEILGKATNGEWGVIFQRVDNVPRHPAQLYEALAYFLIFLLLNYLYKTDLKKKTGVIFGLFFTLLFIARFIIEFFKIDQVPFEANIPLNMGQWLSVPFIIAGVAVMVWRMRRWASDR
ncbi:MAG: prolipoprotein diacylglyceryl transferase [Saprospiraceae bacterium]|nr:prolipoprotein diacylglyceryl transferase [Saprospiraceae bacterium]